MRKLTLNLIIAAMLFNLAGCGSILYPERMGRHHSSAVDIKIAIMDGIGLLFFIVPGVIAFGVDYMNGAIYLPAPYGSELDEKKTRVVKSDGKIDKAYLESLIGRELGIKVNLENAEVRESNSSSTAGLLLSSYQRP